MGPPRRQCLKCRRKFGVKAQALLASGMAYTQCPGVQGLMGHQFKTVLDELLVFRRIQTLEDLIPAIALIAKQGVSCEFHVHSDLVRPSRLQTALHQRGESKALEYTIVGHCMLAHISFWKDSHLFSVLQTPADMPFYSPFLFLYIAPDKCCVQPIGTAFKKLSGQMGQGIIVQRHHHHPTCVLIQTMNEPGAFVLFHLRQALHVMKQGIDQSPFVMAVCRMYDHACLLVQHADVLVLVEISRGMSSGISSISRGGWASTT